ncbi:MAG: MOSC domain-containing protein [Rubrivivax sp.]
MSDFACTLSQLFVHPIKSCAGIELRERALIETGLDLDREWMVVDAHGEMLTQRELPRMALVQPALRDTDIVLRAPGMLALHVWLDRVEARCRVRVWDDEVDACDMGDLAAQWFSDFLGLRGLRLVRFDLEGRTRLAERRWTGELEAPTVFADGFPLLVASTASLAELNRRLVAAGHAAVTMARFRPNLVLDGLTHPHDEDMIDTLRIDAPEGPVVLKPVKPCVRCSIPDIEPATAERGQTVAQTLAGYRADARMKGGLTFGMNAVIVSGVDHTLAVGARVRASL